jgi:hypothetical protein
MEAAKTQNWAVEPQGRNGAFSGAGVMFLDFLLYLKANYRRIISLKKIQITPKF